MDDRERLRLLAENQALREQLVLLGKEQERLLDAADLQRRRLSLVLESRWWRLRQVVLEKAKWARGR